NQNSFHKPLRARAKRLKIQDLRGVLPLLVCLLQKPMVEVRNSSLDLAVFRRPRLTRRVVHPPTQSRLVAGRHYDEHACPPGRPLDPATRSALTRRTDRVRERFPARGARSLRAA